MNEKQMSQLTDNKSVSKGYTEAYTFGSTAGVVVIILLAVIAGCGR